MSQLAGLDAALRQGTQNAERIAGLAAALDGLTREPGELGPPDQAVQGSIPDQAELLRGLMPALTALMAAEAAHCPHAHPRTGPAPNGARPGHQATALSGFRTGTETRG